MTAISGIEVLVQCPKCAGTGEFRAVQNIEIRPGVIRHVLKSFGQCFTCKGTGRTTRKEAALYHQAQLNRIQARRDRIEAQQSRRLDFAEDIAAEEALAEKLAREEAARAAGQ
jgi:DnaJ-class molecular chaperone